MRLKFNGKTQLSPELVVGHHNANSDLPLTAFTKWCPPENGVSSFENAEKAIDLALSRLGQEEIGLLQCMLIESLSAQRADRT